MRAEEIESPTWEKEGVSGVLETLSLLPEARGSGLGTRLVAQVRDEVAQWGHGQLVVTAVASNRDAIRFYEREGFTPAFLTFVSAPTRG